MEGGNYEAAKLWLAVLNTIAWAVAAAYGWVLKRTKANRNEIDRAFEAHYRLKERVDKCETKVMNMPNHDDIGKLHEKVNRVSNSVERMNGELVGISKTLQLIHQSLLDERNPGK